MPGRSETPALSIAGTPRTLDWHFFLPGIDPDNSHGSIYCLHVVPNSSASMDKEIGTAVPKTTSKSDVPVAAHHDEMYVEDDPHVTAFDEDTGKLSPATWAAVFFLGLTFQAAIGFSFSCVVAILVPIALDLEGNTLNIGWIPSGWAVASSVSFAIAGQFSDIFGRRYVMLFGQLCVVIGHVFSFFKNHD